MSVLMPVYNERPAFLEQAVRSILAQTFHDFEFILLDDGSDRGDTLHALTHLARLDRRIRPVREPHRGLTKTLNIGLALCRGEFICRQDSDDWSDGSRLARQVQYLERHCTTALVGSQVWWHQEAGTPLWVVELPTAPADIARALHDTHPFIHGAVCFRKGAFEVVGGYRDELALGQDYDGFWRLCERFGGANLPDALYHYRFKRDSLSVVLAHERKKFVRVARDLADMRRNGLPEDTELALQKAQELKLPKDPASTNLLRADRLMLAGYCRDALRTYVHGIRGHPFHAVGWLKLARWGLFVSVPFMRPWLFRAAWLFRFLRWGLAR